MVFQSAKLTPVSPSDDKVLTAPVYSCTANQHVQKVNWDITVVPSPCKTGHQLSSFILLPFCFGRNRLMKVGEQKGGSKSNRLLFSLKGLVHGEDLPSYACLLSTPLIMWYGVMESADPGAAALSTRQKQWWAVRSAFHHATFIYHKGGICLTLIWALLTNWEGHQVTFSTRVYCRFMFAVVPAPAWLRALLCCFWKHVPGRGMRARNRTCLLAIQHRGENIKRLSCCAQRRKERVGGTNPEA